MKAINAVLTAMLLLLCIQVYSQKKVVTPLKESKAQQITMPDSPTEFRITSYKNVDFNKMNHMLLENAGLQTEIYISNTHKGVIIISSAGANKDLKDFSHILEVNPSYYESLTRQDTTIFIPANALRPSFDFTKASSINHDYKNAFNNTIDPGSGISWSKGTHKDFFPDDAHGKLIYDLILVLPQTKK